MTIFYENIYSTYVGGCFSRKWFDYCWRFLRLVVGKDTFPPPAPAVGPPKWKLDIYVLLFMGMSMIPNMRHSIRCCTRRSFVTEKLLGRFSAWTSLFEKRLLRLNRYASIFEARGGIRLYLLLTKPTPTRTHSPYWPAPTSLLLGWTSRWHRRTDTTRGLWRWVERKTIAP